MTKVVSEINQFEGVNPILNDALQQDWTEWEAFHDRFIGSLQDSLNAELMGQGYIVKTIPGLQVRSQDPDSADWGRARNIKPDVSLYDNPANRSQGPTPKRRSGNAGAMAMPIPQAMGRTDEEYFRALALYQLGPVPGQDLPLGWIEILSPTNKPLAHPVGREVKGSDWDKYDAKRLNIVGAGIPLVEIDILNRTLPLPGITPYVPIPAGRGSDLHPIEGEAGASAPHAFYVAVSDPNTVNADNPAGQTTMYPFDLDCPFPDVAVLLRNGKPIDLNFQHGYDKTVAAPHLASSIDYTHKPAQFDAYRPDDQDRIAARIKTVLTGETTGLLTKGQTQPLPLACPVENARLDLDQALLDFNHPRPSIDLEL